MHHPTDRITHTTAFVTPVVEHWLEREIAQWVHPMKDRSDDPSLPLSYVQLLLFESFPNSITIDHMTNGGEGGGGGGCMTSGR